MEENEIRYISVIDDAIDPKRSKLRGAAGYEGTLDRQHLVMFPGKSPVVFILRKLDQYGRNWVEGTSDAYETTKRYVEVGLVGVEGYEPWGSGKTWRGTGQLDLPNGKRLCLTRDELAEFEEEFGKPVMEELQAVLAHKRAGKAWGRGALPCRLPRSVWDEQEDLARLRAE